MHPAHLRQYCSPASRVQQRGVVLIITLIALVAMTLAAIALIRSVDTGNVVAGNLAFKQGAIAAGDSGTEVAIGCLSGVANAGCPGGGFAAGTAQAFNDIPASGYYATSQETLDVTGSSNDRNRAHVDWDSNNCNAATLGPAAVCIQPSPVIPANAAGYEARYVIHRLCPASGTPTNCATIASTVAGGSKGGLGYGGVLSATTQVEYYRITTRIRGPRNTTSFIETIVY